MSREQRLIYGEDAELYDRARPSYPAQLIDDVLRLSGEAVSWMLDAGCGTGKAAVLFASRGVAGVGVEPDPSMAAVARRNLAGHPWRVDPNSLEDWKPRPDDPPVDLLVSAQAWHWFTPEMRFLAAHAIIRPGGWLALWWNGPADFDNPARRDIDAAYQELAPEFPHRGVAGHGPPTVEVSPPGVAFGPPIERDYPWSHTYSAPEWCDLLRTQSDHRMLPGDRLEALLEAVERAIVGHGGVYTHPYICRLWAAQRLEIAAWH